MKHALRLILSSALLLALVGCNAHESSSTADPNKPNVDMTLKLYSVPADRTESIQGAVYRALGGIDATLFGGAHASITVAAPGKLLVFAPRDAQESIGDALNALGKEAPAATPPSTMNLHFWVVEAEQGPGSDDASLAPLNDALKSWRDAMGPSHFKLVDAAACAVAMGGSGHVTTSGAYFSYEAERAAGNNVNLSIGFKGLAPASGLNDFTSTITAGPGQYIVLAQASTGDATASGKITSRLLVMRVDRAQ